MRWKPRRLDELGYVSRGRSRHRPRDAAHLYGGLHPFIQTGDVKHSNLYITDCSQTYSEAGLAQSRKWPIGTLCITIAANIADTAILAIEACFPDSIIGFIPDSEAADARFIKYTFDALLQKRYQGFSGGATQDNLSQEKLLSITFPVPDVETQRRIADVLAAYDVLIDNNRHRIRLLDSGARLLFREWFVRLRFPGSEHVRITNGLPEGWKRSTVGEEVTFLNRGITPVYDDEAPGLVINQKCVRNGRLDLSHARKQSKAAPAIKFVRKGDVLINSTGEGTLGRVTQVGLDIENCTVDSHVTIARPNLEPGMFYFGMSMKLREEYISSLGRGATNQTELSRESIAELPLLVPTKDLRWEYDNLMQSIERQINLLSAQNGKLREARNLLLPRLMSSELEA